LESGAGGAGGAQGRFVGLPRHPAPGRASPTRPLHHRGQGQCSIPVVAIEYLVPYFKPLQLLVQKFKLCGT